MNGTTACKWDSVIPFEPMWERLNKLIKPNGAIVLFGSEPFSSALRMSNIKNYKYDWIWEKEQGSNFMQAKKQPLKSHEIISIFYKSQPLYIPQMIDVGIAWKKSDTGKNTIGHLNKKEKRLDKSSNGTLRYPKSILRFIRIRNGLHQTQKPVALMEYLVKTYTNENETVLDFTSGSGTTAVACGNTNRRWICIEKDTDDKGNILGYCDITVDRLKEGE